MACRNALAKSGELGKRRRRQAETWMWEELRAQVHCSRKSNEDIDVLRIIITLVPL